MGTKDSRRKSHLIIGLSLSLSLTCGGLSYGSYKMGNLEDLITSQSKVIKSQGEKIESLNGLTNQQKKENKNLADESIILRKEITGLSKKVENYESLIQAKDKKIKKLEQQKKEVSVVPSRGETTSYKEFYVEATGYIAMCREGCTGVTATGYNLKAHPNAKVIAVDPKVIPLGSKVYVEGYGYATALDVGGGIDDYEVDLHFPTETAANNWGRRTVKIKVFN